MLAYFIVFLLPVMTLSDTPSAEKLAQVLFNAIDADNDGKIVPNEAEKFFLGFDINDDKVVSYVEFTTSLNKIDSAFKGHEQPLFNVFDLERDQDVDKADIDTVFSIADINGDGIVTEEEFDTVFSAVIAIIG